MTEEEIAGESGGTVSSRMVRGVRVLTGTGVIYGGTRADAGEQHTFLNEWQRNGLLVRLPPSRPRVWGLRFLGRLTIHRPRTLLRVPCANSSRDSGDATRATLGNDHGSSGD